MRRVLLGPAWGHPAGTWLEHPREVWERWAAQMGAPLPALALTETEAAEVVLAARRPAAAAEAQGPGRRR